MSTPARQPSYLMENIEESLRLEVKTDPRVIRQQARWCGVKAGLRILDAGCGPGKVTAVLDDMVQPGGSVVGLDYSEERIQYAQERYGDKDTIEFRLHDLRDPILDLGPFDLIWVRFVMEYNRLEAAEIVKYLTECLAPGGTLCLMDLDYNCLTHWELPSEMEPILYKLMALFEEKFNFDAYAGRKLYAHLYDAHYQDIAVDVVAHHLIYGESRDVDLFNWMKKAEVVSNRAKGSFDDYPGGHDAFFSDFLSFFNSPRRFTYTPMILCKGRKPPESS